MKKKKILETLVPYSPLEKRRLWDYILGNVDFQDLAEEEGYDNEL